MTPIKNGNIIFATHQEKIDQPRQVLSAELLLNMEFPPFCPKGAGEETMSKNDEMTLHSSGRVN